MTAFLQQLNAHLLDMCHTHQPQNLYDPIAYSLEAGGKRIRPALMQLAYNIYRNGFEPIIPLAAGIETYHNFTLLHDDLMDNSPTRRGRDSVHKHWNANTAILSGDTMLIMACREIAQCPEYCRDEATKLFLQTALEVCEGQQYDMDFERRNDVSVAEYIEMIRLKTAVLLACALRLGAIAAQAPNEEASVLYDFGINIGLAFQLQDDYLDVYGDPLTFGKPIGGDIFENKKTFMLIKTYEMATDSQRKELDRWMTDSTASRQEKIAAVTEIYNAVGTPRVAQELIDQYFETAFQLLDSLKVDSERLRPLVDFAKSMINRKK